MRWGIRAVIGESFAEIFFGNCLALGIPCLTGTREIILSLQNHINEYKKETLSINVIKKLIHDEKNNSWNLEMKNGPHEMLISGKWDATSQLISQSKLIKKKISNLPYLNNFHI